jgi:hypothetical protein
MAYPTPIRKATGFGKQVWGVKDFLQNRINENLYEKKADNGLELTEPKLLTILIRKDKEHHFNFLKDDTEWNVKGRWHDKKHKLFKEDNAEITIQYLDNKQGSVTNKLINLFKQYNKEFVKEEVLYVTSTPLDKTSLDLKSGRE